MKSASSKKILLLVALVLLCALAVFSWNYFTLQAPMNEVLAADARNGGISVKAYFGGYHKPSILVFDLQEVSEEKSPADVFRVLVQFADVVKERQFKIVQLSHRGEVKFLLEGEYFARLGEEYGTQNPVYTMRTFAENLLLPSGEHAYETWTGGLLGVLGRQVDDFNDFHRRWYIEDLSSPQQ